ncbi:MAG: HDOD domain-containing protein [Bryobacterales bacterium]|nr:HDOD domain-containing protein [Bryobacterales bacterium]
MSNRLHWSQDRQAALGQAARMHHRLAVSPDSRMLNRLILEVWGLPTTLTEEDGGPSSVEMARLLELCCFFVQRWEFIPYELYSFPEIVDELRFMASDGFFEEAHVAGLSAVPSVSLDQVKQIVPKLPVFPAVAMQALKLASDPMSSASRLEQIIEKDPVLAGEILKAANSPLRSPARPIRSIRQAVVYMGVHDSSRIIASAALRPLFDSPLLEPLWAHSLEVAKVAEELAGISRRSEPADAFLAGLLHDVGRLALWKLPARVVRQYGALVDQGCEPMFAETLLCGFDHCTAGREVAEYWYLEPKIVEAVSCHHHPERTTSPLAHLLYLAEYWTNSQEDLPSLARLQHALRALELTPEKLKVLGDRPMPEW